MPDDVQMGIYRHYKGALYQVLGLGHDANAEDRTVVIYVGLQLDAAHLGPRLAVRTLDDFLATVHTADGTVCAGKTCFRLVGKAFASRFTYLGPELTKEMLDD